MGMAYRKAVIYYLSGTGNSYRVSTWMTQEAEAAGIETASVFVNNAQPEIEIESSAETLMGLVYPTHGFTAPWHVIKFALRLPRRKSTHAFCAATRAGLRFGKVFTPGMSGSATFLIALILFLKGYRVRGVNAIDMPSNWYSLHPIQRGKSIELIKKRAEQRSKKMTAHLLDGRRLWLTWNNLYEAILGILLAYVSFFYLIFARFFLAKLFFANRNCDGCSICAENCPVGAIRMKGQNPKWPFWRYNCESCMKCAAYCPHNAIEAGHSWAVILWYVTTLPVVAWLLLNVEPYLPDTLNQLATRYEGWLKLGFTYPILFVSYYILSRILRVPFINRIFSLTTFTHLPAWGRYREPETRLKHLRDKKS